jgi:hypothetical protein
MPLRYCRIRYYCYYFFLYYLIGRDWDIPEILISCLRLTNFEIGRREGQYNLIISGRTAALSLF